MKTNPTQVVLTTYFTSQANPLHDIPVPRDSLSYIGGWYRSLHERSLHGVVFHDGLSDGFVEANTSEQVRFVFADPTEFRYSLNDERFFLYLRFLLRRTEIESLFLTDGSDVVIAGDPFPSLAAGRLYVGSEEATLYPPPHPDDERAFGHHTYAMERLAVAGLDDFWTRLAARGVARPVLNAGIVGGRRGIVLEFLREMTGQLTAIGKPQDNLNMGVLNYVLYERFEQRLVTGPPVHSRFGAFELGRRDVWFIHK